MRVLLARHGNTFGPDDKVVWLGANQDIPLVEKGREQAIRLGKHLLEHKLVPSAVYCGPLRRTREFAAIVISEMKLATSARADNRLNEIDYGLWGGLSNDEVADKFGEEELRAWTDRSEWPKMGGWAGSAETFIEEIKLLLTDLTRSHDNNETLLLVSSNGRLRYFLSFAAGEFNDRKQSGSLGMKTGHYAILNVNSLSVQCQGWNLETA